MPVVFVVEDDAIIRESIAILLEAEGYGVREAANGRQALNTLKQFPGPPSMILLDLAMPVMNGIEFRQHQLKDPDIASIPVVVISGTDSLDEIEVLRPLKVLQKPFNFNVMLDVVHEHCRPTVDESTPKQNTADLYRSMVAAQTFPSHHQVP